MPIAFPFVLAALLVFVATSAAAQSPDNVARPEVKPGDTWTYRRMDYWKNAPIGTYRLRVSFAERGVIQALAQGIGSADEIDTTWTADWNAVSTTVGTYQPDQALLKFPLRPGSVYPASYELARRPHGMVETFEREAKVMGWEDVSVPAGRFRALKIEIDGTFQVRRYSRSGTARHVIWYVPEVKRWVKLVYEDVILLGGPHRGPNVKTGEELVSYSVQ